MRKVSYETLEQKAITSELAALMKSPTGSAVASSIFSMSFSSNVEEEYQLDRNQRVRSFVRTSDTL